MTKRSPFRYFKTSPEIIRLAVMMYVRFPLSLRNVEDLLRERGIDVSHEAVRCVFRSIRPVIPTTSGHLNRCIRPPLFSGCEAWVFS